MDLTAEVERVLSIQSHVASGHVGQQAAVFPLQLLGYEVDAVNTVNYSNHSGYGRTGGWKSTPEDLASIIDMMEKNHLLRPSRVVTGYIPNAESLIIISQAIRRLRSRDAKLIYLLDPVMGDAGRLYVAADVIPLYRELLPLATIITPNYFEVETITGFPIKSIESLRHALRVLHLEYQVPHIIISSIPLGRHLNTSLPTRLRSASRQNGDFVSVETSLLCIASSRVVTDDSTTSTVHALVIPRIQGYFSGVGDLFSALVLGHYHPSQGVRSGQTALSNAASRACQTTRALLLRTHLYAMSLPPMDRTNSDEELDAKYPDRKIRRMKGRELRLVKEQHLISRQEHKSDLGDMIEWIDFWG